MKINDKHIEVIVRQMLQKVEITDAGDTTFLVGEQVDRSEFDEANDKALRDGAARPAQALPVLQGITKASLQTRVVHLGGLVPGDDAGADRGGRLRQDRHLSGLKENVIVGRLIPAGTGSVMNRLPPTSPPSATSSRRTEPTKRRNGRRRRFAGRRARPDATARRSPGSHVSANVAAVRRRDRRNCVA